MIASANRKKTTSRKLAVPDQGPIEQIPPELLRPYARNACTQRERRVALIA